MNTSIGYAQFSASLTDVAPPPEYAPELTALWWARRGDWNRAHLIVQDIESTAAAHVHAHLHRVEGDLENAAYWYKRADQRICESSPDEEWETIVRSFARGS